ncbi:MAG: hypothetical protein ACOYOV_07550 [Bacteroidales bacterium]
MPETKVKGEDIKDGSVKAADIDLSAATEKTTPVDNDGIIITDSADNLTKRVKFSSLLTYIKAVFNVKLLLQDQSSMTTPAAGWKTLYSKTAGLFYNDSTAAEKQLASVDIVPAKGQKITVAELDSITLLPGFYNLENVTINGVAAMYAYVIQLGSWTGGNGYKAQILIPYTNGYQTHGMLLRVSSATAYPATWSRVCNDSLTVNGFNVNQNLRTTDSPTFNIPLINGIATYINSANYSLFTKRNTVYNNNAGQSSPEELALFHSTLTNKIRFAQPSLQEHVTNANFGTMTWTNPSTRMTTAQLQNMVIGEGNVTNVNVIPIANVGENGVYRLTWTQGNAAYVTLESLCVYCNTYGSNVTMLVETWNNVAAVWVSAGSGIINNYPGFAHFPHARIFFDTADTAAHKCQKVRLTFTITAATASGGFSLYGIEWFGDYPVGRRNLFTIDINKNVVWDNGVESSQLINFNATIDPTQSGSSVTKTSTWMWQYLVQGINWLRANFSNYSLTSHNHALNNLSEKSYNSLTDLPDFSSFFLPAFGNLFKNSGASAISSGSVIIWDGNQSGVNCNTDSSGTLSFIIVYSGYYKIDYTLTVQDAGTTQTVLTYIRVNTSSVGGYAETYIDASLQNSSVLSGSIIKYLSSSDEIDLYIMGYSNADTKIRLGSFTIQKIAN